MNLLGLELSDAGILVAGGEPPRLLPIDNDSLESAGFALPEKKRLVTGREAAGKARLYPRQLMNRFWDHLSTDPLETPAPPARNQAEVACIHLARIWEHARYFGEALVIAVPGYLQRTQLGLILGMAQELKIPLRGFVSLPVAAAGAGPEPLCLHLDIHLHRFEASALKTKGDIAFMEAVTAAEKGLECLRKIWAEAAAAEFLRATRFDPFHRAETEQQLYNRLTEVLAALRQEPSVVMEIAGGNSTYSIALSREIFLRTAKPVYAELVGLIRSLLERYGQGGSAAWRIQLTHRLAGLPGFVDHLRQVTNARIVTLTAGAAALALPTLWRDLAAGRSVEGTAFFTSRPQSVSEPESAPAFPRKQPEPSRPTHLLYRNLAYPISDRPLLIGMDFPADSRNIRIESQMGGVSSRHCAVQLQGDQVLLTDYSPHGTFVNGRRIEGSAVLQIGHVVRVGEPGETILAIACLDSHEA